MPFTIIAELPPAAARRLFGDGSQEKTPLLLRRLRKSGRLESVFGDKALLNAQSSEASHGIDNLVAITAGDFGETSSLLEGLRAELGEEAVYVAPPRSLFGNVKAGLVDSWHPLVNFAAARALPAWSGTHPVDVSIIDSGVDVAHPQLTHVVAEDFLRRLVPQPDPGGHGTHVAGQIAARKVPGGVFEGVASECSRLTVCRGIDIQSHDVIGYYRALRAALGSRVVNLSLGGPHDKTEERLILGAIARGCTVVAATGNDAELDENVIHYPAALAGVIAVGAVDARGNRAPFSCFGRHLWVCAPGVDIFSTAPTYPVQGLKSSGAPPLHGMTGTSMAAPIVTGLICRMLSFAPHLTPAQVSDSIRGSLMGLWNEDIGRGIVDMHATLAGL